MDPRLPPHQQLAAPGKWPVVGERAPRREDRPWRLEVAGLVAEPRSWTLEGLRALAWVERDVDVHCVTRWSVLGARFGGVRLLELLEACAPRPEAQFASFVARSDREHSSSLPLTAVRELDPLVALTHAGAALDAAHGGPVRLVVPGRYFYKSVKWLERIDVLAEDRLGYWEREAGYHNEADPWREQRYLAPELDRQQVRNVLAARDFSGRDLRGIDAAGRDLEGLDARGAALRDARFQRAVLRGACFDGANLSNAHLEGADLRGARFRAYEGVTADLEGADFRGADLRGADFTGASLFGVTFCPEPGDREPWGPARMNATTVIGEEAVAALTPLQQEFVRRALR